VSTTLQPCNENFLLFTKNRFNVGLAIVELQGPIAGGFITNSVSYERAFSILGLLMIGANLEIVPFVLNLFLNK